MIELTDKVRKRFELQLKKIYVGHSQMKKSRPELFQVHYSGNGHVEITNSMVGVRLSDVHGEPDSDEEFPNMDGIFKIADAAEEVTIDNEEAKLLEDQLNVLYRNETEVVKVSVNKDGIYLVPIEDDPTFVESGIEKSLDVKDEVSFGINTRYLHDALFMMRLLGLQDLTIHKNNSLSPLNITSENLHYIIAQVRLPE